MRRWMMAGGAAVMVMASAASAVEPASGQVAWGARATSGETKSDVRGLAPMTGNPADAAQGAGVDRSGFVTHDELLRFSDGILQRIETDRKAQQPEPTFTDAG